MDITKLPLNKKTTIVAEKYIIAAVTRLSENEAIISYINLKTREEVLRIIQKTDGSQILQKIDEGYWDVYADGKLIDNYDFSLFQDLEVRVDVSTKKKALKIISFDKKIPQSNNLTPFQRVLKG